jgi:hypothetical protein
MEVMLVAAPATVAILLLIREIAMDIARAEKHHRCLQRRLRAKQAIIEYLSQSLERADKSLASDFIAPRGPMEDE